MIDRIEQGTERRHGHAALPVRTNVLGLGETFTDPMWRVTVKLSPVEIRLLRTAPLRRLHFIAHGGASTVSTLQSYSRLEHTLGVLALAVHFRPEDEPLRVAALLHDIGHLPLSHTIEGIAGLDHHAIGMELLRAEPIRTLLAEHRIDLDAVAAVLTGPSGSPLRNGSGLLHLDHLDSFVRSGRDAGRLDVDPAALLHRLDLHEDVISTDRETAGVLVDLIAAEARLHTSWDNVGPISVVRRLARRLLDSGTVEAGRLARMTDAELWAAFDAVEATRTESAMVRYELHRLRVVAGEAAGAPAAWDFSLRKRYRSAPLVHGRPPAMAAPELAAALESLIELPTSFRVWWD